MSGGVYLSDGALIKAWNAYSAFGLKTGSHVFLDNGQLFDTGILRIEGGVVEGHGKIGSTTYNGGWLRPGGTNGVGVLTNGESLNNINGTLYGTIEIELGGTAAGAYDRLAVIGTLYAGGTLDVSFINGFKPVCKDAFDILDFTAMDGTLDTINLTGVEEDWDLSALYETGEIRYIRSLATVIIIL